MQTKAIIIGSLLFVSTGLWADTTPTILAMSYNVENLFDNQHDTLKNDSDFLDTSYKHWTYTKFQQKLHHIASVIANASGWQTIPIIGLLEVENRHCIQSLLTYHMPNFGYRYLHRESHDERGIDCVLLYDPKQFQLLDSNFYALTNQHGDTIGRDLVYAKGLMGSDTIHLFLCHLPSRRGGAEAERRRQQNVDLLKQRISQIMSYVEARIIVMGDMNDSPQENIEPLHNLMLDLPHGKGSYCYKGMWEYLDQFYVSSALQRNVMAEVFCPNWLLQNDDDGYAIPWRTYRGRHYLKGYSDHLPILLYTK